jgi:POT family proton-dependent oligopeptide transporter
MTIEPAFISKIGPAHKENPMRWFGHPGGLATLFFTEMWERFSYYGMRALLTLFMTAPVAMGGLGWPTEKAGPIYGLYTAMVYITALPGGWIADKLIGPRLAVLIGAIVIMSGHISLMFHGVPTFYLGLFLIVIGTGFLKPNISAMVGELYDVDDARRDAGFSIFYMGINIGAFASPLVCGFLAQHPGFASAIEKMGFNPLHSWHWGFGAAAVGMGLGIIQYLLGTTKLGRVFQYLALVALLGFLGYMTYSILSYSGPPAPALVGETAEVVGGINATMIMLVAKWLSILTLAGCGVLLFKHRKFSYGILSFVLGIGLFFSNVGNVDGLVTATAILVDIVGMILLVFPMAYFTRLFISKDYSETESKRLYAIPVFFFAAAIFWSAFEQAGSTLTLFADRFTTNALFGASFPSSWWQSVNALLIVIFAPVFAWLWVKLAKTGKEPSSPMKFGIGLFLLGLGFAVLAWGASLTGDPADPVRVGPIWLFTTYLLHTLGELCLSPVGLSTMTKLAPERLAGQMMGVWFLASAMGNFIGGMVAGLFEQFPLPLLFGAIFGTTLIATIVMIALVKPVRALMAGVH